MFPQVINFPVNENFIVHNLEKPAYKKMGVGSLPWGKAAGAWR
jgi:hypothetical protein